MGCGGGSGVVGERVGPLKGVAGVTNFDALCERLERLERQFLAAQRDTEEAAHAVASVASVSGTFQGEKFTFHLPPGGQ